MTGLSITTAGKSQSKEVKSLPEKKLKHQQSSPNSPSQKISKNKKRSQVAMTLNTNFSFQDIFITPNIPSTLPLQRLLLLRIPHHPPSRNKHPLPPPNPIHILLRHILPIPKLPQILHLDLRPRNPVRIFIQYFKPLEPQLRARCPASPLPNLVREAECFGYGEQRQDGEEWRSFFEGFREDAPPAPRQDVVDAPQDFGAGLDFAAVHCEE